jgi:hypothetical protein
MNYCRLLEGYVVLHRSPPPGWFGHRLALLPRRKTRKPSHEKTDTRPPAWAPSTSCRLISRSSWCCTFFWWNSWFCAYGLRLGMRLYVESDFALTCADIAVTDDPTHTCSCNCKVLCIAGNTFVERKTFLLLDESLPSRWQLQLLDAYILEGPSARCCAIEYFWWTITAMLN